LAFNSLHGSLPAWLGSLQSLELLDVSRNQLSGEIPANLGEAPLTYLYAANNNFSGTFPNWASSIWWVRLENNAFDNFDSDHLEKFDDLRSLRSLGISRNNFECPFPDVLIPYFAYQGEVCVERNIVNNYTGELKGNYLTGEKKFHYIYVKGKLNGVSFRWYKNGQAAEERNYLHGKEHGVQVSYYETGELKNTFRYSEGKLDGLAENFWKSGAYRFPPSCYQKGKKVDISKCSSQKPPPPTTSGGTSSGSGKVLTATPEEP